MKESILFNHNTSVNAENNRERNLMFLKSTAMYINELLRVRGYVYLNQINEMFGLAWDPTRDENVCCIYKDTDHIDFKFRSVGTGFVIDIDW